MDELQGKELFSASGILRVFFIKIILGACKLLIGFEVIIVQDSPDSLGHVFVVLWFFGGIVVMSNDSVPHSVILHHSINPLVFTIGPRNAMSTGAFTQMELVGKH